MLNRIDRYLAQAIIVPLLSSLVIAAMLLLLDRMLKLFDFVINEGGPVDVVWRMLGNLLPEYLALGIPIGVMLGILMAFRRLALSSELDALRAVGISYNRLLRVPMLFALVFAVMNFGIVGWLQPLTRYAYENLRFELRSGALGASIKVGEFTDLGKGMTLRVEQSFRGGQDLQGLFVEGNDPGDGASVAVTAARGTFLATDDPEIILLRLYDGTLVHTPRPGATPRVLSFSQHDLPVKLPDMAAFRKRGEGNLEATLPELVTTMTSNPDPKERISASATFNRRMVQCVTMFILPFFAVALAVPPKRSTSSLGVFLSIIGIVTFHKFTEYGERMGQIGRVDPVLSQWVPFVGFLVLALWLYGVLAEKPGGQPIGALDRWFGKLASWAAGLAGRLVRRPDWRDDALSAG
ncbi:MAG: LptF/LptG family permease [Sphingomonadales bacterium]